MEKSSWKTGGGVRVTLFPLYDAGRKKRNFILIGMLHLGWFLCRFGGGGGGVKGRRKERSPINSAT